MRLIVNHNCTDLLVTVQSCDNHLTVSLGTAKIDELDDAFGCEHDIGTFDVAMDDAVVVKVVQTSGNLPSVVGNGTLIQRAKPACTYTFDQTVVKATCIEPKK